MLCEWPTWSPGRLYMLSMLVTCDIQRDFCALSNTVKAFLLAQFSLSSNRDLTGTPPMLSWLIQAATPNLSYCKVPVPTLILSMLFTFFSGSADAKIWNLLIYSRIKGVNKVSWVKIRFSFTSQMFSLQDKGQRAQSVVHIPDTTADPDCFITRAKEDTWAPVGLPNSLQHANERSSSLLIRWHFS